MNFTFYFQPHKMERNSQERRKLSIDASSRIIGTNCISSRRLLPKEVTQEDAKKWGPESEGEHMLRRA